MLACDLASFWMTGNWPTRSGAGSLTVTGADIQAGDVVLKAGSGTLQKILVVTNNGANPILIYDNAAEPLGTVVAVVKASALAGEQEQYYSLGYTFGLVIAQTVAAGDITIQF